MLMMQRLFMTTGCHQKFARHNAGALVDQLIERVLTIGAGFTPVDGAGLAGGLAAISMLFLNQRTKLREDAIIGLIYTSFFGLGLFMVSLSPTSVNIQTIVLGNVLAISPGDTLQLLIISVVTLTVLTLKWQDFMVAFLDENHGRSIGLNPDLLKVIFFALLAASTVAALQTVGAFLVIASSYVQIWGEYIG
mgnify:CR=1 FL=1